MKLPQKVRYLLENIDISIASIGLFTSLLMLIFNLIVLKKILAYYIFGLLCISFLIYLAFNSKFTINHNIFTSDRRVKLFSALFFLLYSFSIIILYYRPDTFVRPLIYFYIVILMSGVLAGGCLSADRRYTGLIFIQILLLGMNIGWSHLLIVPGLIGIDPWFHYGLTTEIINGHNIPIDVNSYYYCYSNLPIFHLFIAITSIVTNFSYKFAAIVSVSFGQIICNAAFVYLFAEYLFKNNRIGLFASLLLVIGSPHIAWTYISIPNGFGGIFWLILLYLLLTKKNPGLIVLLMITIILTHVLVGVVTAISLLIIYISFKYRELIFEKKIVTNSLLILCFFSLALLGWWTYGTGTISEFAFFAKDFSLDFLLHPLVLSSTVDIPQFEYIFPNLGIFLIYSLAMIGILYMISLKGSNASFTLAFVSLIVILFPFLFYMMDKSIFGARFAYFALILLSIPIALTLYLLGTCKIKTRFFSYSFIIGIIIVISFLSIMSVETCEDNHTFAPVTGRTLYYTQSEIAGSDFFGKNTIGTISSDYIYSVCTSSSIFFHLYGFDFSRLNILDYSLNTGEFHHDNSIKIIRNSLISGYMKKGYLSPEIQPDIDKYLSMSGFSKIYASNTMTGYTD